MDHQQKFINQAKNILQQIKSECVISIKDITELSNIFQKIEQKENEKELYECQFFYFNHSKNQLNILFRIKEICYLYDHTYLFVLNKLQQKRNFVQKVSNALGFYNQEVNSRINDKQYPPHDSFFIYNSYLVRKYQNALTPFNREMIFDAHKLKNENHPFVRNLRIDIKYNIKNLGKMILDCQNLIKVEIIVDFFKKTKPEQLLQLINKQNPQIKISLYSRYYKDNYFTKLDDTTLKNLNLEQLQFIYQIDKNDEDIILEQLKQFQKIDKLRNLKLQLDLYQRLSSKQCQEIGDCIAKCLNLNKLKFSLDFTDQILIEEPFQFFQGIKPLKNLQYLNLELTSQIRYQSFIDLNQIIEVIIECQNLIELILLRFKYHNFEFLTEILPEKIGMLKNLITLIVYLDSISHNQELNDWQISKYESKIKAKSLRLVTLLTDDDAYRLKKKMMQQCISAAILY